MRRLVLLVSASMLALLSPLGAREQAARIPTFCDITAAQKEVQAGARVTFTLSLKNMKDMPVEALADTEVTLTSDSFAAPVAVVVPKGKQSATTTIVMAKAGIGRVKASSAKYPPAFTIVPVKPTTANRVTLPKGTLSPELLQRLGGAGPVLEPIPSAPVTSAGGRSAVIRGGATVSRRGFPAGARTAAAPGVVAAAPPTPEPAPPPPPPAAAPEQPAAGPQAIALDVQVNPDPVHRRARAWTADVMVLLLTPDGLLATADRDLPLQLSTHVGQIDPRVATIRAGDSSTAATAIRLTSSQSGSDTVTAVSALARSSREIRFDAPEVEKLRVAATPSEVLSDGRATVNVAVLLEDADGHVTETTRQDIKVHLDSDLGDFAKDEIVIPKGESSAETTFSSRRYGTAKIAATSVGIEGSGTVKFLFPWLMLALSIAGGASGSFAREASIKHRSRRRVPPIARHLALGALFGLIFFALALFGAIGSIPKLSVDIGRISALNEIGALALGFIGGYIGNKFWK